MRLTLVDAFTQTPGAGNRAGVVLDAAGLDAEAMQRIARVMGASETAFMLSAPAEGTVRLRYFAPAEEIPFCGHATVATFHLLAERGVLKAPGTYRLECKAGTLDVELEATTQGVRAWIVTPRLPWVESPVPLEAVMSLVGGTVEMVDRALPVLRNGHRVMVPLRRREDVWALAPRSVALAETLRPHGLSGVYVFSRETKDASSVAHARYFVPGIGVAEDPVTGSAAGPIGMYLATQGVLVLPGEGGTVRARIEQGDAIGKPGRIDVEVTGRAGQPERARIGGIAVTMFDGTLRA
ncbi:PhzF family phenazine biosynthesis protein [Pyxidicoccus fallax]|uniref:PhzF family phenazine biosynthesis protein n=1 Tax=Pyxidicoccus fallax TaxID=394095 RepID=A0A848L8S2_9BACT|nr:PhzF family phenazine biosynthesis protein [Pyxidicoccus fallax]NMO15219.1 PhzF family phenazine biosynthesis protein [Pyxidicoccus fallax]NPC76918.1 PhzF family phenazine biosynthesis protein [Pyxidicoccus fallax]